MRSKLNPNILKLASAFLGEKDTLRLLAKCLTAHEVAELLSIKLSTVRALTYRRRLPCIKISSNKGAKRERGGVRYRLIDILSFLENHSRPALSE